jgi:hypothetical protein
MIPEDVKNRLSFLQKVNRRATGGKEYWSEGLRVLGVYEDGNTMRFRHSTLGYTTPAIPQVDAATTNPTTVSASILAATGATTTPAG